MNGYDPTMLTMAYSIHADRLAQAATSLRRAQGPATAASDTVRGIAPLRAHVARRLLALAGQIAPPVHTARA